MADIEGDEWALLPSLLNSVWFTEGRVRQFVMEIHLRPERVPIERDLTLLTELKRLGYHLFNRDENWRQSPRIPVTVVGGSLWRRSVNAQIYQCLELSYVFVGPSLLGGLWPPPAARAPQWRFGKPVRY